MADLGNWLSGSYRISVPLSEDDLDQGLPEGADATDRAGEDSDADSSSARQTTRRQRH